MLLVDKLATLTRNEHQALEILVRRLHAQYHDQIQAVFLFGSKARGDAAPDSDIDVVVILSNDDPYLRSNVRRLAARVSPEYDLLISARAVGAPTGRSFRDTAFLSASPFSLRESL